MNAKRSLLTILVTLALTFSLVACSGGGDSSSTQNSNDSEQTSDDIEGQGGISPKLLEVSPPMDATNVRPGDDLTLTFSTSMNSISVAGAMEVFDEEGNNVEGEIFWNEGKSVMRFSPNEFLKDTVYTVSISDEAQDANGSHLENSYSWNFQTMAAEPSSDDDENWDDSEDVEPSDNDGGNDADSSDDENNSSDEEDDDADDDSDVVNPPSNDVPDGDDDTGTDPIDPPDSGDDNSDSDDDDMGPFNPPANDDDDADQGDDVQNPEPFVTSHIPAHRAVNVAVDSNIQVVFSEKMDKDTLTIVVKDNSGQVVTCRIDYEDVGQTSKATIVPVVWLREAAMYAVEVRLSCKSSAGENLAEQVNFTFTTAAGADDDDETPTVVDTVVPTITSRLPGNNAQNVTVNNVVRVAFSEEIKPASLAISLRNGTVAIPGTVNYTNKVATFTPVSGLPAGATVSITVSGIQDLAGNRGLDNSWSFTTAASTVIPDDDDDVEDDTDDDDVVPNGSFNFINTSEVNHYTQYDGTSNAAILDREDRAWEIVSPGYHNLAFRRGLTAGQNYVFRAAFSAESEGVVKVWAGDSSDGSVKYAYELEFTVHTGVNELVYEFTSSTTDPSARVAFKCGTVNYFMFNEVTLVTGGSGNPDDDADDDTVIPDDDTDDDDTVDPDMGTSVVFNFADVSKVNHYTQYASTENAAVLDRQAKTWDVVASGYHNLSFRSALTSGQTYIFEAKFVADGDGVVTVWAGDGDDEFNQYDDDLRFQVMAGQTHTLRYEFTSDTTDPGARIGFKCKTINYFMFQSVTLTPVN